MYWQRSAVNKVNNWALNLNISNWSLSCILSLLLMLLWHRFHLNAHQLLQQQSNKFGNFLVHACYQESFYIYCIRIITMRPRYTFLANFNLFKISVSLCLWTPDPLIDSFYQKLSIKGSGAHKQRLTEIFEMLKFAKKVYLVFIYSLDHSVLLE